LEAPQHCPVVTVVAGHYMWTPIPSNQYLLPVAQTCTTHTNVFTMWYRTTRANPTEFAT
jgi:hypothetical protein